MSCAAHQCANEATDLLEVVIPPEQIPEGMEDFPRDVEYCPEHGKIALLNSARAVGEDQHPAFRWLRRLDWEADDGAR